MEANCDKCGKDLAGIEYVYPITHPKGKVNEQAGERRPPLCRPCWTKIVNVVAAQSGAQR